MKRRCVNETWQIISTHNEIRLEQQFNIVAYSTAYEILKLTSLPIIT